MLFDAPRIFIDVPDISEIYRINESQIADIDSAVIQMDNDLFFDTMGEDIIKRWERILKIIPFDDDTLATRRLRIQSKVFVKLPYSYRAIEGKLKTLCPNGLSFNVDYDSMTVDVQLVPSVERMRSEIEIMLDDILPLNMLFKVTTKYNPYENLKSFTHGQLASMTHKQMRENVEA